MSSAKDLGDHLSDFTHLKTLPMVHLGDTRFCVPVLDLMFDRLTIRAYFDIIDPLSTDEKNAFGSYFGRVVELYVHSLLREMLGEPAGPVGRWFTPNDYIRDENSPEGPDAIIFSHDGASIVSIFMEIKSSRPVRAAVVSGDLDKLRENWNQYLIGTSQEPKAARQLDRAISDFRAGRLKVPGYPPDSVTRIYPVIVTLDPWPLYLDVFAWFLDDVDSLGLLRGDRTAALDIWSCFDLELASPRIRSGQSFADLLKDSRPASEHIPLWLRFPSAPQMLEQLSPLLDGVWDRLRDSMVRDLGLRE